MAGLSDPYAILRVGPQTFTSRHIDNTDSPKWEEMYEVRRVESFMESCVIITLDVQVLEDSIMYHFNLFCIWWIRLLQCWECSFSFMVTRLQPASTQIPLSVFIYLCVSDASGHSPWSAWSGVGGGGIWQRHRPGWFPGQVHMHSSCLLCAYVESRIVTFHLSPFMFSWKKNTTCYF